MTAHRSSRHTGAMTWQPDQIPCTFCEIVAGRLQSSTVYADDQVVAFMDIMPVTPGHLLVVPRVHADRLQALSEEGGAHVFRVGHKLAKALYLSGLPCEGVNVFLADGAAAFQEVFHVHLHVLPRTKDDGFRIDANWQRPPRAELDATAAQVRHGLTALPQPPASP
jgi:histidine triad (HIT) family protein